jgi:hypothetical protein
VDIITSAKDRWVANRPVRSGTCDRRSVEFRNALAIRRANIARGTDPVDIIVARVSGVICPIGGAHGRYTLLTLWREWVDLECGITGVVDKTSVGEQNVVGASEVRGTFLAHTIEMGRDTLGVE